MYRAFKIDVNDSLKTLLNQQGNSGSQFNTVLESYNQVLSKDSMKSKLLKMIRSSSLSTGTLNADSIWDEWFPKIDADVFISHSSKDAGVAKSLANWLKLNHRLTSFIDSEIWGHSDELLKELDNEYCLNHGGETYSYEKRNGSTAHVHMMLSYALTRMIDRTECFIFLESHNSATAKESVNGTYSPWIFHELATVDTIETNKPTRLRQKSAKRYDFSTESVGPTIHYPIQGKRLTEIEVSDLSTWLADKNQSPKCTLDVLYENTPFKTGES